MPLPNAAPTNSVGVNNPPDPPEPSVSDVASAFAMANAMSKYHASPPKIWSGMARWPVPSRRAAAEMGEQSHGESRPGVVEARSQLNA